MPVFAAAAASQLQSCPLCATPDCVLGFLVPGFSELEQLEWVAIFTIKGTKVKSERSEVAQYCRPSAL